MLFVSEFVYLLTHFLREVLVEFRWEILRYILPPVTFCEFVSSALIVLFISLYLVETADPKKFRMPIYAFYCIMGGVHLILMTVAQINKLCFDYPNWDYGDGLIFIAYVRQDGYFISNIVPAALLLADVILLIVFRKRFEKRVVISFLFYILLTVAAAVAQLFYEQAQFIIWATVISTVVLFITMMKQTTEDYKHKKTETVRLDTELTMAARIQEDMLPREFPAFPNRTEFDIFASMVPAKEVGGDFYNFFLIDDDTLGIIMADVSDKGVPAAMFMMASDMLLKNNMLMKKRPKEVLEEVNQQLCKNNREEMFVTVWLGILDLRTGKLTAVNAGHEKPALKSPGGSFELYEDKHGLMVGYLDYAKYTEYELTLEKGSKLFLYTDGVAEANNASEELFGTERMIEALRTAENGTPEELLQAVDKAIDSFVKDAPQFDDITMLCLEYKGAQNE